MNESVLNIILLIISIIVGALTTYFKTNATLKEKTSQYINEAEKLHYDATNAGEEKFEYVVDKLYYLVPTVLKPIITRATISALVQNTFNSIQSYAKIQLDKMFQDKE